MSKIMVIRHAEKPNGEGGLMPDGTKNPEALTATGWRRANALVRCSCRQAGISPIRIWQPRFNLSEVRSPDETFDDG
jgi:broad specificity phosphatase PhoE